MTPPGPYVAPGGIGTFPDSSPDNPSTTPLSDASYSDGSGTFSDTSDDSLGSAEDDSGDDSSDDSDSASGPLMNEQLYDYGETQVSTGAAVYRTSTGAPVVLDVLGQAYAISTYN